MTPFALSEQLVPGMSSMHYHGIQAFSSSFGREMVRSSPAHAMARTDRPQTQAMVLGSAVHAGVLEPHAGAVAIAPDVDRRTTAGKEAYSAFVREASGKIILTHDQGETYRGIVDAVAESRAATNLLHVCQSRELSGFTVEDCEALRVECLTKRIGWQKRESFAEAALQALDGKSAATPLGKLPKKVRDELADLAAEAWK